MLSEADIEATIDRRVQRRLSTDTEYRHAANGEVQSLVEHKIELQEERYVLCQLAGRSNEILARVLAIDEELAQVIEELN
jgi:hypothetical protein